MKVNPSTCEPHNGGWEALRQKWIRIHFLFTVLLLVNYARFGLQTVFAITHSDLPIAPSSLIAITKIEMLTRETLSFSNL